MPLQWRSHPVPNKPPRFCGRKATCLLGVAIICKWTKLISSLILPHPLHLGFSYFISKTRSFYKSSLICSLASEDIKQNERKKKERQWRNQFWQRLEEGAGKRGLECTWLQHYRVRDTYGKTCSLTRRGSCTDL